MVRQTKSKTNVKSATKNTKKVTTAKSSRSTSRVSKPTPKAPIKTKKIAKKVQAKAPVKVAAKVKLAVKTAKKTTEPKLLAKPATKASRDVKSIKVTTITKIVKTSADAKPKKTTTKTVSVAGYTPSEYNKYKETLKQLSDWSNQKLKDSLRNNLQSMSGNKDELIAKVADGMILGSIPRCSACFGGRPAFDFKKGTYTCKGYRDDTDFINCHKTFALGDIKRNPWV